MKIFSTTSLLTGLLLIPAFIMNAQTVSLENLGVDESARFQLEAVGSSDFVLTLHRIEDAGATNTPVGIELGMAGVPKTVTEVAATPEKSGLYFVVGRDLATSTFDTDGDGIIDRTERQAALFLNALDGGDAGIADVFDVVTDFSISAGVPAAGAGTIEAAHDVDIYRFQGTAGTGLFFDSTDFSGLSLHRYYVIDPYGNTLGSGRFGVADLGPVALPYTGEYILMVGDLTREEVGTYSFEVSLIPLPEEFVINIGDTIELDSPAVGAGNIETAAAFDIYTFTGSAGQNIFVDTLSFSSAGSINYQLFDPNDVELDNQQMNNGDMGTVTLPFSGTYTLRVGEEGNSATGTYSIRVTDIPAPDVFAVSIGDTFSDGSPGSGAGNIEVPGAYDRYTFTATAGQSVFVDTLSFSTAGGINYRLFDPNDTQLGNQQMNHGDMGTVVLPITGTYTLEVGEAGNSATGTYSISVTDIPAPDVFAISLGDTLSDGAPGPGAGNIEVPGAYDRYTFTATAGQSVFVDTLSFSTAGGINYRLFDPNGSQLDNQQMNHGDMGTVLLPLTGTYTLEVGEAGNSATGTYSIAITDIPAPEVFAISIGDTLSDGVPGPGAGNIEVPGSFDHYTFTGTAGQNIFFDTVSFSTAGGINYRLFDPNDTQIDNQQFNHGDMGSVALPLTGTYTLRVGEAGNSATGTYSIGITDIPAPDVFAVSIGDSFSDGVPGPGAGNIEAPGVLDRYTFSGNSGDSIDIIMGSQTGLTSVGWRLLDSSSNIITSRSFFGGATNVSLPTTGTYTLEFGEINNSSIGTYSMSVVLSP